MLNDCQQENGKKISDEKFIFYLNDNANEKLYRRSTRGASYFFRLKKANNPTLRMRYSIVFYSSKWEKDHTCPALLIEECLDRYNSGLKKPIDYKNKTGMQSLSRRGRYLLEVLYDAEKQIS